MLSMKGKTRKSDMLFKESFVAPFSYATAGKVNKELPEIAICGIHILQL